MRKIWGNFKMKNIGLLSFLLLGLVTFSQKTHAFMLPITDGITAVATPATFDCQPNQIFQANIDGVLTSCQCPPDATGKIIYPISNINPTNKRSALRALSNARAGRVGRR
jgi:hypothetical protein